MIREMVPRMYSVYFLEDGATVHKSPYFATATVFALNDEVAYIYGQLSQKPLSRAFYTDAFNGLRELGFKKAVYFAPHKRKALGGTPIEHLPNFYCINLEE